MKKTQRSPKLLSNSESHTKLVFLFFCSCLSRPVAPGIQDLLEQHLCISGSQSFLRRVGPCFHMHGQVTAHHLALWRPGRPRGREGQVLCCLFLASVALHCSERLALYGFCRFLTSHSCHADASLITGPSAHSVFSQHFRIKHKLVPSVLFLLRRRIIPSILAFRHSSYFLLSEFSFITLISKLSTFPCEP